MAGNRLRKRAATADQRTASVRPGQQHIHAADHRDRDDEREHESDDGNEKSIAEIKGGEANQDSHDGSGGTVHVLLYVPRAPKDAGAKLLPGARALTVGIVGVGLIGGSIGMALKASGHRVLGYDTRPEHIAKALERHCLDAGAELAEIGAADAVFIAVPPAYVTVTLEALEPYLAEETAVTDCTSVKSQILDWVAERPLLAERFVGGHPMAGHEKSGPAYASDWMFRNAKWILTPTRKSSTAAKERITALVKETGAKPVRIEAAEHDRHVAVLSHLPHLVAAALVELGADVESPEVAAGSWRDLTRVGGVDPELWSQILSGNSTQTRLALDSFIGKLMQYRDRLDDADDLRWALAKVAQIKESQAKKSLPDGTGTETPERSASRAGASKKNTSAKSGGKRR